MELAAIDRVAEIEPHEFRRKYLKEQRPVIITHLTEDWPANTKWTWDHFKSLVGQHRVGVYNNTRAGAKVPVNGADDYMLFGDYLDLISKGPAELRIFLFNIFKAAPGIVNDFSFPHQYLKNVLTGYPMLFAGGAGSIAHMHYDIDLSHIFHTQFIGHKRVLLLSNSQSPLIYRMPSTVESAASFVDWHNGVDEERFPALKYVQGYQAILGHGETLFMPSGYWHHMQYIDSGIALSLRAIPEGLLPKLNGLYHILGMRGYNNLLIKLAPEWWYHYKRRAANRNADAAMKKAAGLKPHAEQHYA